MYKKIMFLIITLSIISVGNSTVVMAKENIVTEIVDFPVTINYEEYNVDDYNANDMLFCFLGWDSAGKRFCFGICF